MWRQSSLVTSTLSFCSEQGSEKPASVDVGDKTAKLEQQKTADHEKKLLLNMEERWAATVSISIRNFKTKFFLCHFLVSISTFSSYPSLLSFPSLPNLFSFNKCSLVSIITVSFLALRNGETSFLSLGCWEWQGIFSFSFLYLKIARHLSHHFILFENGKASFPYPIFFL